MPYLLLLAGVVVPNWTACADEAGAAANGRFTRLRLWGVTRNEGHLDNLLQALGADEVFVVRGAAYAFLHYPAGDRAIVALRKAAARWAGYDSRSVWPVPVVLQTAVAWQVAVRDTANTKARPSDIVAGFLKSVGVSQGDLRPAAVKQQSHQVAAIRTMCHRALALLWVEMRSQRGASQELDALRSSLWFAEEPGCRLRLVLADMPSRDKRVAMLVERVANAEMGTAQHLCEAQALADEGGKDVADQLIRWLKWYRAQPAPVKEYWRIGLLISALGGTGDARGLPVLQSYKDYPVVHIQRYAATAVAVLKTGNPAIVYLPYL